MNKTPTIQPNKKFRMTRQRRAILEVLQHMDSHPTVDEVYKLVRHQLPRVSLGTVYRNLEFLSERLMIQKLEQGGSLRRFDARTEAHYHVRCSRCDRVDDLSIEPIAGIEGALREVNGYEITGHRLEFLGLCPRCKEKGEDSHNMAPREGAGREEQRWNSKGRRLNETS